VTLPKSFSHRVSARLCVPVPCSVRSVRSQLLLAVQRPLGFPRQSDWWLLRPRARTQHDGCSNALSPRPTLSPSNALPSSLLRAVCQVCTKYDSDAKEGKVSSEERGIVENQKLLQKYSFYYKRFKGSNSHRNSERRLRRK
jgi:hypothetical protein